MPGISIERAGPADWTLVRQLRLDALAAEPQWFGGAREHEAMMTEVQWRATLATDVWFIARTQHQAVGLVAFYPADTFPEGAPQLGAMWVHRSWRRRGVAGMLTAAVEATARRSGWDALGLWVTAANQRAVKVYQRLGYEASGDCKPAPRDPDVPMLRFVRRL